MSSKDKKNKYPFPMKNKNALIIMKSTNPKWYFEIYNHLGIFKGYAGKKNSFV